MNYIVFEAWKDSYETLWNKVLEPQNIYTLIGGGIRGLRGIQRRLHQSDVATSTPANHRRVAPRVRPSCTESALAVWLRAVKLDAPSPAAACGMSGASV